jgi:hypothetical protein
MLYLDQSKHLRFWHPNEKVANSKSIDVFENRNIIIKPYHFDIERYGEMITYCKVKNGCVLIGDRKYRLEAHKRLPTLSDVEDENFEVFAVQKYFPEKPIPLRELIELGLKMQIPNGSEKDKKERLSILTVADQLLTKMPENIKLAFVALPLHISVCFFSGFEKYVIVTSMALMAIFFYASYQIYRTEKEKGKRIKKEQLQR